MDLLDPPRKGGEALARGAGVEGLVTAVAEHRREIGRLDAAERDVRIGDGERPAAPVGGRAGIRARGIRAHAVPAAVEMQDRSAPSGDGVDAQHRRPHADPRHLGLVLALELARIVRDVGRGAAHVEADHPVEAGRGRGARHADDAAGRPGQDRILAAEGPRVGETAVGLHEKQPGSAQLAGHLIHVPAEDGREVGVHDRGVAARHQLHQRARPVGLRHLREADAAGDLTDPGLVPGVAVAVHAHHGDRAETLAVGVTQVAGERVLVEFGDHLAAGPDPLVGLDHPGVERFRQDDIAVEDARPVLVGDPERVGESLGDDQHGRLALPFEQGVRRHRGAQPDDADPLGRHRLPRRHPEQPADSRDDRVVVPLGVLRQQLAGGEPAIGLPRDDVGERATPVNPEVPPGHRSHHPQTSGPSRRAPHRRRLGHVSEISVDAGR